MLSEWVWSVGMTGESGYVLPQGEQTLGDVPSGVPEGARDDVQLRACRIFVG